jgi:hypothetical protein
MHPDQPPLPALTRTERWIGIAAAAGSVLHLLIVLYFMQKIGFQIAFVQVVLADWQHQLWPNLALCTFFLAGVLFFLRNELSLPLYAAYLFLHVGGNLLNGKAFSPLTIALIMLLLAHGLRLRSRGKLKLSPLLKRLSTAILPHLPLPPKPTRRLQVAARRVDLPFLGMLIFSGFSLVNLLVVSGAPYRERGELYLFFMPGTLESFAFLCSACLFVGCLAHFFRKSSPTWFFLAGAISGLAIYFSNEDPFNLMAPSYAIAFWGYSVSLGAKKAKNKAEGTKDLS